MFSNDCVNAVTVSSLCTPEAIYHEEETLCKHCWVLPSFSFSINFIQLHFSKGTWVHKWQNL